MTAVSSDVAISGTGGTPGAALQKIPPGFDRVRGEAFIETVGPIYVRKNASGSLDIGCLALSSHMNRFNGVHGGMLATLVDYALGVNVLNREQNHDGASIELGTVSLNIDYIGAGKSGDWLTVTTRVDKETGRLRFCHCEMRNQDDRLLLRASAVMSARRAA